MAVIFMDGGGCYTTLTQRWTAFNGGSANPAAGRDGRGGIVLNSGAWGYRDFPANYASWYCGFAYKWTNVADGTFMAFLDAGTVQLRFAMSNAGRLQVYHGGGALLGQTAPNALLLNAVVHLGICATIDNAAGAVTVYVAGVPLIALAGIDTQQSANAYVNRFQLQWPGFGGSDCVISDLYLSDSAFLGDRKVTTLLPAANGGLNEFAPSAGNNFECVDEQAPNEDVDYVSSSTPGEIDRYDMANFAEAAGIDAVQLLLRVRKDDAGIRTFKHLAHVGVSDYRGPELSAQDGYRTETHIWDEDPDTTNPWTQGGLNAAEFGVEEVS
jgi:hypothetical protein